MAPINIGKSENRILIQSNYWFDPRFLFNLWWNLHITVAFANFQLIRCMMSRFVANKVSTQYSPQYYLLCSRLHFDHIYLVFHAGVWVAQWVHSQLHGLDALCWLSIAATLAPAVIMFLRFVPAPPPPAPAG